MLDKRIAIHESGHISTLTAVPAVTTVYLHRRSEETFEVTSVPPYSKLPLQQMLIGFVAGGVAECLAQGLQPETWEETVAVAEFAGLDDESVDALMGTGICTVDDIDRAVRAAVRILRQDPNTGIAWLHTLMQEQEIGTAQVFEREAVH